jgi:hypothetical protein
VTLLQNNPFILTPPFKAYNTLNKNILAKANTYSLNTKPTEVIKTKHSLEASLKMMIGPRRAPSC